MAVLLLALLLKNLIGQWIGIDVSVKAYELVKERLQEEVASKDNLFQFNNKLHYSTYPPKRTDNTTTDDKLKKYVYVISNKHFKGMYKVGIAKDIKSRLNSYQTSDPHRSYKLEYQIYTEKYREIEKQIHKTFDSKHEWVRADLNIIIEQLKSYLL